MQDLLQPSTTMLALFTVGTVLFVFARNLYCYTRAKSRDVAYRAATGWLVRAVGFFTRSSRGANFWDDVVVATVYSLSFPVRVVFQYARCVLPFAARRSYRGAGLSKFISAGMLYATPDAKRDVPILGMPGDDPARETALDPSLEARLADSSRDVSDATAAVDEAERVKKEYDIAEALSSIVVALILIRALRWLVRRGKVEKESVRRAIEGLETILDWLEAFGDVSFVLAFLFGAIPRELRDGTATIRVLRKLLRRDSPVEKEILESSGKETIRGSGLGFDSGSWMGWLVLAKRYVFHLGAAAVLFLLAGFVARSTGQRVAKWYAEEPEDTPQRAQRRDVTQKMVPGTDVVKASAPESEPQAVADKAPVPCSASKEALTAPVGLGLPFAKNDPLVAGSEDIPLTVQLADAVRPRDVVDVNTHRVISNQAVNISFDCGYCGQITTFEFKATLLEALFEFRCNKCNRLVYQRSEDGDQHSYPIGPVPVPEAKKQSRKEKKEAKKKKAPAHGGHVYDDDKPRGGRLVAPERAQAVPPFDGSRTGQIPLYDNKGAVVGQAGAIIVDGKNRAVTLRHCLSYQVYFDTACKVPVNVREVLVSGFDGDDIVFIDNPPVMPAGVQIAKLDKPATAMIWNGGKASTGSIAPSGDGRLIHRCSTQPGWSGSLIHAVVDGSYRAVGLHQGADTASKENFGVSFFRLN